MSCFGGASLAKKQHMLESQSPLGAYLSQEELAALAKACTTARFTEGGKLPESPFYIVMSGQIEVREGDDVLCTKSAGAFFTRRAGLIKKGRGTRRTESVRGMHSPTGSPQNDLTMEAPAQRNSIVQATSDLDGDESFVNQKPLTKLMGKTAGAVLWVKADKLETFLSHDASRESADVVNAISRTNIGTQLSKVPFIEQAGLEPADLRALGEICSYAHYPEGKQVFAQGDSAENFYILLKGAVDITINVQALRGTGDTNVKAAVRGVGDSFGVAALVYNAAERKYTATASKRSLCLVIAKPNFSSFLAQKPSLENALMRSTKRFLLQRYAAMNVPIFGHIDEKLLTTAANLASFTHFEKDGIIYRQGEAPHAFYVVLHGEVRMTTARVNKGYDSNRGTDKDEVAAADKQNDDGTMMKETKKITESMLGEQAAERVLTVGQHFGEVGVLLPQTPCIATAVATTRCTLLTLESSAFIELFGQDGNLLAEMQLKLLRSGCTLKAALNHNRCKPLFVKHIEGEYSGENIKFYDDVAMISRAASTTDTDGMRTKLKDNLAEYIVDGSPQQVNIPGILQKQIKASMDGADFDVPASLALLKRAQSEIYMLMSRDNLPRFVKSEPFLALLKEIGSYDASVTDLVSENDLSMLVQDGEGGGDEGARESALMGAHLRA